MKLRILNMVYAIVALLMLITSQYALGSMFLLFAIFFNVSEFVMTWLEDKEKDNQ